MATDGQLAEIYHIMGATGEHQWIELEDIEHYIVFLSDADGYYDLIQLAQHLFYISAMHNALAEDNFFSDRGDALAHIWRLNDPKFRRYKDGGDVPDPVIVSDEAEHEIRDLFGREIYDGLMDDDHVYISRHLDMVKYQAESGRYYYDLVWATAQLLRVWSNLHLTLRPQVAQVMLERASLLYAHFGYDSYPRVLGASEGEGG